jgi:hypothetical protein
MKISVISIGCKVTGTPNTTVVFLSTFLVEGNAKFQLDISENKDVMFFLSKFPDPLKSIHGPFGGPWTPG